jgi:hypothetical protein
MQIYPIQQIKKRRRRRWWIKCAVKICGNANDKKGEGRKGGNKDPLKFMGFHAGVCGKCAENLHSFILNRKYL